MQTPGTALCRIVLHVLDTSVRGPQVPEVHLQGLVCCSGLPVDWRWNTLNVCWSDRGWGGGGIDVTIIKVVGA